MPPINNYRAGKRMPPSSRSLASSDCRHSDFVGKQSRQAAEKLVQLHFHFLHRLANSSRNVENSWRRREPSVRHP
jgi:hypothetical protein